MAVILCGGEKGGTGKSTTSVNLAVMASLIGRNVALLDCDKQGTSRNFIDRRRDKGTLPTPDCYQISGKHVYKEIASLAERYDDVIIDAGGQDSVELRSSMVASELTLMISPVQASAFDLETLIKMDELVETSQVYNPKLNCKVLITRASTHVKIKKTDDAIAFVDELENINRCNSVVCERVAYQYASNNANAVVEYEKDLYSAMPAYKKKSYTPKASIEMCSLFKEAFGIEFNLNEFIDLEVPIKEAI
ncbi:hypothetical protein AVI51_16265 (plasmid) [Piscirickettsia salmonis]|uniref:ParA-like protein n=1 Tax=Piscirickettsia salmonis TaxID=1238 RepID=A0A9Q5YKQ8_PISSA|nr:division plane positioning ATPase MipZ [Piscirickettsia salmonis]RNC77215.1 chromosome partitioning protein [Piscirickettsiaceae bacterium NZ-RLO2]APS46044.1 hypothetical protein AVI48_16645 [Piscirickettsia salmonis]APS49060.1 hypothetical protein AVI49_15415 [Piscirickettsia salmonis]APS52350.1 hypothetical protein AVI50_15930 [Piscirickettsia salmonis]APS55652.1 hypothetical protein AVI51_16265 [Piscirickettsia salmonis]